MSNDFAAWFEREVLTYDPPLRRFLLRKAFRPHDADDLRQETYARFLQASQKSKPRSPKAFLSPNPETRRRHGASPFLNEITVSILRRRALLLPVVWRLSSSELKARPCGIPVAGSARHQSQNVPGPLVFITTASNTTGRLGSGSFRQNNPRSAQGGEGGRSDGIQPTQLVHARVFIHSSLLKNFFTRRRGEQPRRCRSLPRDVSADSQGLFESEAPDSKCLLFQTARNLSIDTVRRERANRESPLAGRRRRRKRCASDASESVRFPLSARRRGRGSEALNAIAI